jgi:LmbE family N-acetylglucosaminyl deacetylase
MKNVALILAPHTDDGELGCGGTMARLLEEGYEVYYVAFSTCRESVPEGMPSDILSKELCKATETLGIKRNHVIILDFPVREFVSFRQKILDEMIRIGRQIEPTIVFAPSLHDIHQDHHVIAEEAMRAFKKITLFAYEVPWNNFTFNNQIYVKLEKRHLEKKIEAIACYESQNMRDYASPEFTYGQAKVHGVQIGQQYAEIFEAVRYII